MTSLARAQSGWKAGAAKVDITPQEPIALAGYGGTRISQEILQPIYLKALAVQDQSGKIAVIVTSDLVGLSLSMVETIAQNAQEKYGLTRDRLILNYSHNHSCPVTGDVLFLYYDLDVSRKAVVERYTQRVLDQYIEVLGGAIRNLTPATLTFEQGLAGIAVNRRRSRPGGRRLPGPVDQDVPVLAVRGTDGKLRAILFGYSCHNTTLGRLQVSGDYAGYAQAALEKTYPGVIALFVEGCGGDANPLPRYQGDDDREGRLLQHYAYPVQVWQFGHSLTFIGLTAEPVVDYSLRFKGRYGWDTTWVAGYNNELLAYIPSLRVLNEGGYEGADAMLEYGLPAPFGHAIEETIAEKVDELVRETSGQ